MKRLYYPDENSPPVLEEAEPVCGEDFCDACGDCLSCFGGDPCYRAGVAEGEHIWTRYEWEES